MHEDTRRRIDDNVRKTVGVAALRRILRLLSDWEAEERRSRKIAFVIASVLVVAILAAAFVFYHSLQLTTIN